MTITIVADQNMPMLQELLSPWADVRCYDGRNISSEHVRDADALLVRSVTRVDASLLAGSRVRFVASATIGTDHVDQQWLIDNDVAFAHAPGCNAASVADYVCSVLAVALDDLEGLRKRQQTASVIGFGQTGSRVAARLHALGLRVQVCDPFVEHIPQPYIKVPLETALNCDVLTLHTPLTQSTRYPTFHLLNASRLARLPQRLLLINAARGAIIDNQALSDLLIDRPQWQLALDVWEGEPNILKSLADQILLATPHIAGYALEGKQRGSWMVVDALKRFLLHENVLPAYCFDGEVSLNTAKIDDKLSLNQLLLAAYDVRLDDKALRNVLSQKDAGQGFDQLRKHYPVRHEYASQRLSRQHLQSLPLLGALTFRA